MKSIAYLTFLFTFLFLVISSLAASFDASVSPTSMNANESKILNFTVNNTDLNYNIIQVNITLPSGFSWSGTPSTSAKGSLSTTSTLLSWTNTSTLISTGTVEYFWFTVTSPSSIGSFNFTIFTLDFVNGTNSKNVSIQVVDQIAPRWSSNLTTPSSPTTYSPGKNYTFNITWTDNVAVSKVIFEWNGTTNYTDATSPAVVSLGSNAYGITLTSLAAGNYTYRWYANDTMNQWNSTDTLKYEISKASNPINIYFSGILNQNLTIINETQLNITVIGYGTINLYENGNLRKSSPSPCEYNTTSNPLYATNKYNFTAIASGDENYTANSSTYFVMDVPSYTVSTSIPSTYSPTTSATFNINFSSPPGFSLLIEGDWYNMTKKYSMTNTSNTSFSYSIILPAGTFFWQIYGNYSDHIFNLTPRNSFTVSKATPTLDLIASPSWTVAKGTQTNVSCSSAQVSVSLYRNNISVSNPDVQTLDTGTYVYKCNNTETANYSSTSVTNTLTVKVYLINLAFTKAESLILVRQNSFNTTIVEVKNTGELSQIINFTIEDINSTWYSINATNASLASGKSASFLVNFSVGNVEIKDYSGKFKAYSPNKTIESNFTLRVLPAKEKEAEINSTLVNYIQEMLNLEKEINQAKAQGLNVSLAEEKLNQLKTKIEQGENYTAKGDYFNAYIILKEIETLINDTKNELSKVKQIVETEKRKSLIIYVVIGICIALAIILAYLFWPTKTKPIIKPEVSKEQIWFKLKRKWEELSKKRYEYKGS